MKLVLYEKVPPLDKLMAKLGTTQPEFEALKSFLQKRQQGDRHEAPLPDLKAIGNAFQTKLLSLPVETHFAAVDLLRCSMVDPRVSGYYAEEKEQPTVPAVIKQTLDLGDACPHNLRLVTIHLASNLFSSHLYIKELLRQGDTMTSPLLVQLISTSLLDTAHVTTRVAAASLAFNLTVSNYRVRREESREGLAEGEQVELAASILEALQGEEGSDEAVKALLLALGYLVDGAPKDGELADLCSALDARAIISGVKVHEKLTKEVGKLL